MKTIVALAAFLLAGLAQAACDNSKPDPVAQIPTGTISITRLSQGAVIRLEGLINRPMIAQLLEIERAGLPPGENVLELNSPGGSTNTSLEITQIVRRMGLSTRVAGRCHSGCATVFQGV